MTESTERRKPRNRRRAERTPRGDSAGWTPRLRLVAAIALGLGVGVVLVAHVASDHPAAEPEVPQLITGGTVEDADRASLSAAALRTAVSADGEQPASLRAADLLPPGSLDPSELTLHEDTGRYSQTIGDDVVYLGLSPAAQQAAESLMARYELPYGGVAAVEIGTGRVLALASHSQHDVDAPHMALAATQPAASTFKIVTAAALTETAGVPPGQKHCIRGGRRGITADLLRPDAKRDTLCHTLGEALAASTNVVFARLADQHLDRATLDEWARSFGFEDTVPFPVPLGVSRVDLPTDRVKFAAAAAGFHHTTLSPLHGAMIAASAAQDGVLLEPQWVTAIERGGDIVFRQEPRPWRRAMAPATARIVADMMRKTGEPGGTAFKYVRRASQELRDGGVAGKTGSLTSSSPDGTNRHNSWFVGFAPADDPKIAVAALVVNDPKWHIKGTTLAMEVLGAYLDELAATVPAEVPAEVPAAP